MAMGKGFRVFHKLPPDRDTPYSVLMESKQQEDSLMFESGAVVVLSAGEVEPLKKQYTKILDAYGCLGVLTLNTGGAVIHYLVMVTSCLSAGKIGESEVFKVTAVQFISLRNDPSDEERIADVRKLLSSGTFYFSWRANGDPWDLSLCAQRKLQDHATDNRFFWNRMLHVHLQRYGIDCSKWLLKIMCGGVEIRTIYAAHHQAKACLISRLSCERAGTRFNVRGVNDDGHVANFVETEQVIFLDDQVVSFIQIRGSVPLFWEQPGINVGSHKVHMSRGYEAAAPAYDRHLRMVKQQYGNQNIINLLGIKEGERMLSQAFENHHKASSHAMDIPFIHFDYHSEIKGSNLKNLERLKAKIIKQLHEFDFFFTSSISRGEAQRQQTGTMRTNCLDCLDRTNAVQTMIGLEMLPRQLESLGLAAKPQMVSRFEEVYRQIWGHNGDHISRIYAGTGALGGGRSKYTDATRSASRAIQNNFLDSSKQEAIDVLLTGSSLYGDLADKARALMTSRYLHASPSILQSMVQRAAEYTKSMPLRVCVATYNVNGGSHFRSIIHKNVSLTDWLLDAHKTHPESMVAGYDYDTPVDIFAVGFEEIVDLNASNIMKASTTNANEWRKEVLKTISRDHKYVELIQIQLVGVVLFIFFRPHLAPLIRDVAVDKVKTGLGGATGNKGGVGIRFLINSTSFCFVCAHLAAGQSNFQERNDDYQEITRRMAFPMGRSILSHDYVFWCGDFNYRIDLPNEEVKQYISEQNWEYLQACDQLNIQRGLDKAFAGFNEAPTNFAPTYKYDMFSDDWDTSEKARTPAWTDRVLWRYRPPPGCSPDQVKQLLYTRAELRMSDHRPVVALFQVETQQVIESQREAVLSEVIGQQGPPDATVIISLAAGGEFEDDDLVQEVVERFTEVGDVIIVRFVGSDMWVLYKSGQDALDAVSLNQTTIGGQVISVRLKTESWLEAIEQELQLCASNTGPLYNAFTNSLLGDDFSVPSMEFDMGDEDEDEEAEDGGASNSLQQPAAPPSQRAPSPAGGSGANSIPGGPPSRPPQPSRPETPPTRPPPVAKSSADTQLIVPESTAPLRSSPSPEMQRRQPPQRPSAPPAKPPPPQRPPGGPSKSSPPVDGAAPGSPGRGAAEAPKMRQPLRPPPSAKANASSKRTSTRISSIGLPTNVKHTSHASTPEEAAKLLEMLMRGDSVAGSETLPPPLKPSSSTSSLTTESEKASAAAAPKPMPRSRTSHDIDDDSKDRNGPADALFRKPTPTPAPRQRSLDNLDQPESSGVTGMSSGAPRPPPRPVSQASHAPVGGVAVFPVAPKGDALGSGPPPIPKSRPLSHPAWDTEEQSAGMAWGAEGQSSTMAWGSEGQPASAPQTAPSSLPPVVPNRNPPSGASLLDTPNSPTHDVNDPFDTSHVHKPFVSRQTPDPFDTSSVASSLHQKSEPDPFDTSVAFSQGVKSSIDPFDTSAVCRGFSSGFETADDSVDENVPCPDSSPPPTPPPACPSEPPPPPPSSSPPPPPSSPPPPPPSNSPPPPPSGAPPPPPPRRNLPPSDHPSGPPPSLPPPVPSRPDAGEPGGHLNMPPPVPNRPGGPPPVPRRPVPSNQSDA